MNGIGIDRDLSAERFKRRGQLLGPQNGQVRFGRGAEGVKRIEHAIGVFGDQCAAVAGHTADAFGNPHRVAAEQLVVFRRAQMPRQAQFHDEIVHELLRTAFGQSAVFQIAVDVNIKKCAGTPQRHGGAVLLFDCSEVAEIQPLNRLTRVGCGLADVIAVKLRHFFEEL